MKQLNRIKIPKELIDRKREILGELKLDTMYDCVYNHLLTNDIRITPLSIEQIRQVLPNFTKDYQLKDLSESLVRTKVFNINKPGYGKTFETIMWIKCCLKEHFKALILCPKSVIETWKEQLNKYWPNYLEKNVWCITNYEQLYNEDNFIAIKSIQWDVIVLDESHKIKSMKSKITKLVFQLSSKYRHCLTGTPIKNRPEDLAAQLKWLDPRSITNYTDFQFAFCNMQRDNWGWKAQGLTKDKVMVANLQKLLDVYCVGGSSSNNIEKELIKVKLKMDEKVKALYKKIEAEVVDTEYLLDQGIKVSSDIEAATRRQQLASNPQLFNPQLKNVKFEWILDWLEGTDEKVLIVSKFAKTIGQLEKVLGYNKVKYSVVRSEQDSQLRKEAIENWKRSKQVLLGTTGVLGTGVDGLQECCHYMIFIDRDWTASGNEQAEGRIARTGQSKKPIIYVLQCIGTIDVRIERIQLDKGHDVKELLEPIEDEESLD